MASATNPTTILPFVGVRRVASFLTRKRALMTHLAVLSLLAVFAWMGGRPRDVSNGDDPLTVVGLLAIVLGLAIRTWAAGTLHKSTVLTMAGPYRMIRNPLYVGSLFMTLGFSALFGQFSLLLLVLGSIGWLYAMKVRKEERTLAERFGSAWTDYARATPRFLPRRFPRLDLTEWRFALWARNHEYRAVAATICGLVVLKFWHAA